MKHLKVISESVIFIWMLFFAGFILGVMLTFFDRQIFLEEHILNPEFIFQFQKMEVDKRALFFLCMGKRLRAFFLMFLLSFSVVNYIATGSFFFFNGICTGSIMELLALRYGARGILMYLELVLPHGMFYAFGFSLLGYWCIKQRDGTGADGKQGKKRLSLKKVYLAFLVVITGVILESYVNFKIFL